MESFSSNTPAKAGQRHSVDLAAVTPGYARRLTELGYKQGTVSAYTACVHHYLMWRNGRRSMAAISEKDIGQFLDDHLPRCHCQERVQRSRYQVRAALRQLVVFLRGTGTLVERITTDAIDDELLRFDQYMQQARGLAKNTRTQRLLIVCRFLKDLPREKYGQPPRLRPEDLRNFIARQQWSPGSSQVLAGALRSYLRYRAFCGDPVKHLLPAIVSPAHWRLAPLPETLSSAEIAQLTEPFPPDTPSVHRAYAMVRCVVDLGLRSCEVVGLSLSDIDWSAGTIRIRQSKSRRADALPLPEQTARAIAEYLRHERPPCHSRRLFVRHVAPVEKPVGAGIVRRAVKEAYRRCGMSHTRVHVLRHTMAKRLLESGGTLKDVADVLRHRALDTTLIYTKVDLPRLAAVALPWPGCMP